MERYQRGHQQPVEDGLPAGVLLVFACLVVSMAAARDLDVRALETFAITVGQALALGAPLAETLAAQSREIRAAHRATVEREIERAPVKLLIPTGTLILPALLLSILGPLLGAGGMM